MTFLLIGYRVPSGYRFLVHCIYREMVSSEIVIIRLNACCDSVYIRELNCQLRK